MSTIREVAALAQVSAATVSRVINHDTKYKMTNETIERVWKAIAELNYKAPTSSKEHMSYVRKSNKGLAANNASKKIGCIMNVQGGKYNDPYYLSILSGFEKRVMEEGYEMGFIKSNEELYDRNTLFSLYDQPVSGLIIMNTLEDEVFEFVSQNTPFIVGIDTMHTSIDNVAYDHYASARIAVTHLYNEGYRKIGFIGGDKEVMKGGRRYSGYYSCLHSLGLEFNPDWVLASNWDEKYCDAALRKAYERKKLPEAYFVASDLMAISALRTFYDMGLRVPEDIAVCGLSNIEISKYSNPPLTTVAFSIEELGRVAANTLFDRFNGDDTEPKTITLQSKLLKRSST